MLPALKDDNVYRLYLMDPSAVADITAITADELNANPTNDPSGLIWNLTCALDTASTTFDLDPSERDDSTTFCQTSGDSERMSESATVVFGFNESKDRWLDASSLLDVDGFNTANLAKSLLQHRGQVYYALMSIGKAHDAPFVAGDQYKLAEVATDWLVSEDATGANRILTQSFAFQSDLAWNYTVQA